MRTTRPSPTTVTAVSCPTAASATPPRRPAASAVPPQQTLVATAATGARSRSRIDDRFQLFDGGGPSRARGGLVHPAGQPERFVTCCERVASFAQDHRGTPEPSGLRLPGGAAAADPHEETPAGRARALPVCR